MKLWQNLNIISVGGRPEVNARSVGLMTLLRDVLHRKEGHVSEIEAQGNMEKHGTEDPVIKYHSFLKEKGGRLIYKYLHHKSGSHIYIWDHSIIELRRSNNYLTVNGFSHDENFLKDINAFIEKNWALPAPKAGQIYAIMQQGMQLKLQSLGNAGIPLVDGNYTPKVMEDYKYAMQDLRSASPSGRIVILEGKPGTGKTHLVRAMLMEVPNAMFVLISPEVITTLAGPELLPLLLSHRGASTGPIILVLEDADRCLVTREEKNMSLIQSLLNLGDGILGSLLDLRIVATTNASKLEMESALLRPGRLSKRLEVGPLNPLTAQRIFHRLLPHATFPVEINGSTNPKDFEMTLAEIYALARKHGWSPDLKVEVQEIEKDYDENDIYDNEDLLEYE